MSSRAFDWSRVSTGDDWDKLVHRSAQGTLFSESDYLGLTGRETACHLVTQGSEPKAIVCMVRGADPRDTQLDDLVIYGGLMFIADPSRQRVKRRYEEFQITDFVAQRLEEEYRNIALALSPSFDDMRPFLWRHYHDADPSMKFRVDLRYTSILDLAPLSDPDADVESTTTFNQMETVRRYSVREARRKGGKARRGANSETLVDFYRELMSAQGELQPVEKLQRMQSIMDMLVASGRGEVYEVLDDKDTVVYVVAYGWDRHRAYYLYGAGHPTISHPWQGSLAHWEAFKDLARRVGIREVDLEGVNSPQRGWFKLGFGGDLRKYYHVFRNPK